jgi:hypothetical protein
MVVIRVASTGEALYDEISSPVYGDATYLYMSPMINGSSAVHASKDGSFLLGMILDVLTFSLPFS